MTEHGPQRPERKFDPARADQLDAPERDSYLPDAPLVELLELGGEETVVDYGAGTGRLAIAVRAALGAGGRVIAIEENDEMVGRLSAGIAAADARVETVQIAANHVPERDATADRVLAVNLLHEVSGERALEEMRRLLRPNGLLLVADWERGRDPERAIGPPDEIIYTEDEAAAELERAGFEVERRPGQRWHFVLIARPDGGDDRESGWSDMSEQGPPRDEAGSGRDRERALNVDRGDSRTPEELRDAVAALSSALGAADPDYARVAALERLAELRAAGTLGEEDYKRERRRLMGHG